MSGNWGSAQPSDLGSTPKPLAAASLVFHPQTTLHQRALLTLRNRVAMFHYDIARCVSLPATHKDRVFAQGSVNHQLQGQAGWTGDLKAMNIVTEKDYNANQNAKAASQAFNGFLQMWNGGTCNWQQAKDLLLQAWAGLTQYHKNKYGELPF
jgi:hypothetical protein